MKNIIVILLLALSFTACKKEKVEGYKGGTGIYFYNIYGDSVNYSFANQVGIVVTDTIFVDMQVMGPLSDQPRDVLVVPAEGTTAVEGTHYKLPKMVLPANQYTLRYPVVIYNAPDLKTKTVRLVLKVGQSKDLGQGASGYSNVRGHVSYKINFNNQMIKPDYWLYIQNYFGDYSNVKYKFMIDVLGISNLRPDVNGGTIPYSDFINYNGTLKNALEAYNALHGPLLDETGKEVSFPL